MELFAEACEEASIREVLGAVGLCDEFVEFNLFP